MPTKPLYQLCFSKELIPVRFYRMPNYDYLHLPCNNLWVSLLDENY